MGKICIESEFSLKNDQLSLKTDVFIPLFSDGEKHKPRNCRRSSDECDRISLTYEVSRRSTNMSFAKRGKPKMTPSEGENRWASVLCHEGFLSLTSSFSPLHRDGAKMSKILRFFLTVS